MFNYYFCQGGDLVVTTEDGRVIKSPFGNTPDMIRNFYRQEKCLIQFESHEQALEFMTDDYYSLDKLDIPDEFFEYNETEHPAYMRQIESLIEYAPQVMRERGMTADNLTFMISQCYVATDSTVQDYASLTSVQSEKLVAIGLLIAELTPNQVFNCVDDVEDFTAYRNSKGLYRAFSSLSELEKRCLIGAAYNQYRLLGHQ